MHNEELEGLIHNLIKLEEILGFNNHRSRSSVEKDII